VGHQASSLAIFFGEALIDIVQRDDTLSWHLGGAPANAAAIATKLGANVGLVATVGDDFFGREIIQALERIGVESDSVRKSKNLGTSLAVAMLDIDTTERFTFYRKADLAIKKSQIRSYPTERIGSLILGSLSLAHPRLRRIAIDSILYARNSNATVIFDANYRASLWSDAQDFRRAVTSIYAHIDAIKVNRIESRVLTGHEDPELAAEALHKAGIAVVLLTLGTEGCLIRTSEGCTIKPVNTKVQFADVVGTGDAFLAACIARLQKESALITEIGLRDLGAIVDFGNETASRVAKVAGAGWGGPDDLL
jgi:fructokinase